MAIPDWMDKPSPPIDEEDLNRIRLDAAKLGAYWYALDENGIPDDLRKLLVSQYHQLLCFQDTDVEAGDGEL
jgi:hypothetical protein